MRCNIKDYPYCIELIFPSSPIIYYNRKSNVSDRSEPWNVCPLKMHFFNVRYCISFLGLLSFCLVSFSKSLYGDLKYVLEKWNIDDAIATQSYSVFLRLLLGEPSGLEDNTTTDAWLLSKESLDFFHIGELNYMEHRIVTVLKEKTFYYYVNTAYVWIRQGGGLLFPSFRHALSEWFPRFFKVLTKEKKHDYSLRDEVVLLPKEALWKRIEAAATETGKLKQAIIERSRKLFASLMPKYILKRKNDKALGNYISKFVDLDLVEKVFTLHVSHIETKENYLYYKELSALRDPFKKKGHPKESPLCDAVLFEPFFLLYWIVADLQGRCSWIDLRSDFANGIEGLFSKLSNNPFVVAAFQYNQLITNAASLRLLFLSCYQEVSWALLGYQFDGACLASTKKYNNTPFDKNFLAEFSRLLTRNVVAKYKMQPAPPKLNVSIFIEKGPLSLPVEDINVSKHLLFSVLFQSTPWWKFVLVSFVLFPDDQETLVAQGFLSFLLFLNALFFFHFLLF